MHVSLPRILTGSYSRWRPSDGLGVRSSLGKPKWYPNEGHDLPVLREVMPEGWMLHSDDPDWELPYRALLERRGPDTIARAITDLAEQHHADQIVVLCFEADPAACHRSAFGRWLSEQTGVAVPDLTEVRR